MPEIPPKSIYLIRHATPDWTRKDIPYNIPPGPSLIAKGERQARQLAAFLQQSQVKHVYTSPMQRALQTAQIVIQTVQIPYEINQDLIEWKPDESEESVKGRIWPFINNQFSQNLDGDLAFVSHGGPITLLLKAFGMQPELLDQYCHSFDGNNPLPPAGAWKVTPLDGNNEWQMDLVFKPDVE